MNAIAPRKSEYEIVSAFSTLIKPHLRDPRLPAFWYWPRPDRVIISVNPQNLRKLEPVLSQQFTHALSTHLSGAPVVATNSVGVFFQVGYIPKPPTRLDLRPLALSSQPGPTYVPIGMIDRGPFWLPLEALGAVLVGGSRRMGKSRLLHGWIQSLLNGGETQLYLYDGKDCLEFNRYSVHEQAFIVGDNDLGKAIETLREEARRRSNLFRLVDATSLLEYNARVSLEQRLQFIALFVDEVALVEPDAMELLSRLIARDGAYGIIPVLATQRTGVDEVPAMIKTNAVTRIAFPVPAMEDSRVILGRAGAEKLPKQPGYLLMPWDGRVVRARAFEIKLPGGPAITGTELDLARRIIEDQDGRVSIHRLIGFGLSEWDARKKIDEWEARGWVSKGGQGVTRTLTPALKDLLLEVSKSQSQLKADEWPKSQAAHAGIENNISTGETV